MKLLYSTSCCSKPIWLCFFNGTPNEMFSGGSKATFSNSVKMNGDQWMSRSKKDTTESSIHNSGAIFRLLKPCDSFIGGKYWNLGSFPMKTLLYGHHSFSLYFKCSSGISFCVPQIKGHPGFERHEAMMKVRKWWEKFTYLVNHSFYGVVSYYFGTTFLRRCLVIFFRRNKNRQNKHKSCGQWVKLIIWSWWNLSS